MPLYEYQCDDCGTKFDSLRSISSADQEISCEKCKSLKTHRLLSTCFTHGSDQPVSKSGCGGCNSNSCSGCSH